MIALASAKWFRVYIVDRGAHIQLNKESPSPNYVDFCFGHM